MTIVTTNGSSSEADALKRQILEEHPRLTPDSRFDFACHQGLSCFNTCCADVNIVLTPYDVLRLRRRLGLGSEQFIVEHTVRPFTKDLKLPVVLLAMRDDERKRCPFVTDAGCSVYDDRPWACRMYPVGVASSQTRSRAGEEFYFVLSEDHCRGHLEKQEWTIAAWLENQGVAEYDDFGERFKEVTFLELSPKTGRTHQIRVHLASIGHPILGDPLYGRKGKSGAIENTLLPKCVSTIGRQALHAHRLGFIHPLTGERVEFVSPLPQDMQRVLESLRLEGTRSSRPSL